MSVRNRIVGQLILLNSNEHIEVDSLTDISQFAEAIAINKKSIVEIRMFCTQCGDVAELNSLEILCKACQQLHG
jgi:hypothetical protein